MSFFALVLFIASTSAFGQGVEELVGLGSRLVSAGQARNEKDKLSRASREYNADQPDVPLGGARAVIRPPKDQYWSDSRQQNWLKSSVSSILTAAGCRPVWDDREIDDESAARAHHRNNPEVDQATVPAKGRIKYRQFVVEFNFTEFEKGESSEIALGRWWRQTRISLSRETAYCGLTLSIRDGDTGEELAVYKTLCSASSADNIGFFTNSLGFSSNGNSRDSRRFRAMENALREMREVLRQKCR